jgi:GT2 family glycosyltransferase
MIPPAYSIVIATFERPRELTKMLSSVGAQTHRPERVVIVDSSKGEETRRVANEHADRLPVFYERALEPSAARQRNQGAVHVDTPLIAFIDDDAVLPPDLCAQLSEPFAADEQIGGIAGRIDETPRPVPRGLLRWYYRLQAGFPHPTYGGLLFGPAINCYPSYTEARGELQPSNWLSSTCVFYRTELFRREEFPKFAGYSFMEDVHLSGRIGKTHRLYFHRDAVFQHRDAPSSWKRDYRALARSRLRNQRLVAREVLGFTGPLFEAKLLLHRLFVTAYLLRQRSVGWRQELLGTWGF